MNDQRKDRELQELFAELRTEDASRTPDFQTVMARVRDNATEGPEAAASEVVSIHSAASRSGRAGARRFGAHRWTWMGGVLAAAAIAAVMLMGEGQMSDQGFEDLVNAFASDPALGAWQSPTDALLELPGREIVTTVPRIGRPTFLGVPGLSSQEWGAN